MLQIAFQLSASPTLHHITELLAVAWDCFCSQSESVQLHCSFALVFVCFNFVFSKASKEAGQALVGKAASPPFESQHHHLLHCLEKTTVNSPFFPWCSFLFFFFSLWFKSCVQWKRITLASFIFTILGADSTQFKIAAHKKHKFLLCIIASLLESALHHHKCQPVTRSCR